jgi:ATP-dependent DNA helicase RecQ
MVAQKTGMRYFFAEQAYMENPATNEDRGTDADDPVAEIAWKRFGIPYIFPWQRLVMANIIDAVEAGCAAASHDGCAGTDGHGVNTDDELFDEDGALRGRQIILLPTGAGKSLCFQAPALILKGQTLVVYPILALVADQDRSMRECGIEPALFRGGQDEEERDRQFARLEGTDGKAPAPLIIANPEVLVARGKGNVADGEVLRRIAARNIAHLAIDEAHCVAEWGDTFRPAYLELARIIDKLDPPAVTAFTATASPAVLSRIAEALFGGRAHLVRGESDRPNIMYSVHRCVAKEPALIREVARRERPLIVFCSTRGGTERMAILLGALFGEDKVRFYHAGLERGEKTGVERWFFGKKDAILTATCAFGMGVNKRDIRTVIHRDAPPSIEAYVQEAGRGGRDGAQAEAVLLWSPEDRRRAERAPEKQRRRAMELVRLAESGKCRRDVLLEALGDPAASGGPDAERTVCSGCDVCDGTAVDYPPDAELTRDFIERNRRCFSRAEIADALCRAGNRNARERYGFFIWKRTDFACIMKELERERKIREIGYWPLRGKVTAIFSVEEGIRLRLRSRLTRRLLSFSRPGQTSRAEPSFSSAREAASGTERCN